MKDITNIKVIYGKGILFLFMGVLAVVLILMENLSWKTGLLLGLAVWSFCRLYYFAFYVIEHYVDPDYKFSGVFSFLVYLLKRRNKDG